MHCTVLSVSLVAAMGDVFDSLFVLEAGDVEGKISCGLVSVDVVVPVGMDPLLKHF